MYKLWKWLFIKARSNFRSAHLNVYHNDIKCENCKNWFSISGIDHNHSYDNKDFGYSVTCGQCGHMSHWNCVAFPFPARCNESGEPIQ